MDIKGNFAKMVKNTEVLIHQTFMNAFLKKKKKKHSASKSNRYRITYRSTTASIHYSMIMARDEESATRNSQIITAHLGTKLGMLLSNQRKKVSKIKRSLTR